MKCKIFNVFKNSETLQKTNNSNGNKSVICQSEVPKNIVIYENPINVPKNEPVSDYKNVKELNIEDVSNKVCNDTRESNEHLDVSTTKKNDPNNVESENFLTFHNSKDIKHKIFLHISESESDNNIQITNTNSSEITNVVSDAILNTEEVQQKNNECSVNSEKRQFIDLEAKAQLFLWWKSS